MLGSVVCSDPVFSRDVQRAQYLYLYLLREQNYLYLYWNENGNNICG